MSTGITYEGLTINEWADKIGINESNFRIRVKKHGWQVATTMPRQNLGPKPGHKKHQRGQKWEHRSSC